MGRVGVCVVLALLAQACGAPEGSAGTEAALSASPAWLAGARVADRRGSWELVVGTAAPAPEGTDIRPAVPMAVRTEGRLIVPPEPVLAGRLARGAVVWVTVSGSLLVDDGALSSELATDVISELAVSPDGTLIAFATRPGPEAGVYAASLQSGEVRKLTYGLASADRPLFVDDDTLVVVGARASGIAGVWTVRARAVDPAPRQLTNVGLRTGRPLGPGFVPPPAYHDSMRVEQGALVYDDGEGEQRVPLSTEASP